MAEKVEVTAGVEGYDRFIPLFIESCQSLDFHEVCKDFITFLPEVGSNVLDVGAGAGQNSAALAKLGFNVIAVEPMQEFIDAAKAIYKKHPQYKRIKWLSSSLPDLECLDENNSKFDFVLIEGVWHHLDEIEREQAVVKLSSLINKQGKCAISLRNGPAGMGSRVFKTDAEYTIDLFKKYGFECILNLENLASIMPHKEDVKWSRIVLKKKAEG